ncbi:polysaccharide deacetylase family protein [Longibacter sp.]|uniref:polysaccharide deacetylase family protein n=1 Tax=Longibacter sp. TaxID=2045415 RepID=UPI003EB749D2
MVKDVCAGLRRRIHPYPVLPGFRHTADLDDKGLRNGMVEVCMLHHVLPDDRVRLGPKEDHSVTPHQLRSYLTKRKSWTSLSPAEMPRRRRDGAGYLLTFDDGYRNNLTNALPVLEEYDAPALIFVTTGFIDGDIYPYELELAEVIRSRRTLHVPEKTRETEEDLIEIATLKSKEALYQTLRKPLKPVSHSQREAYMNRLADANGYDREHFQTVPFLSWEEIASLDRHPLITIGAHTHEHPVLTRRLPWPAFQEMSMSKQRLEDVLGHKVHHFSYPYGRSNRLIKSLARLSGFEWAFTTDAKRVSSFKGCDPFAVPRIDIRQLV